MTSYVRYSHHARRALTHAGLLVTRYQHDAVDTGHLLAGLMLTTGSIGCQALTEFDLTFVRAEPVLLTLYTPLDHPPEIIKNNEDLENTLALAADESTWLGNHYIGTEHLLLGMTRTNAGKADNLLKMLAVSPEQVRRHVRNMLNEGLTEFSLQLARRAARLSELSRRVINAAEQMAVSLDHPTVGVGHLLLVMLLETRSPIAIILRENGLDEARLRIELSKRAPTLLVSIEGTLHRALDYATSVGSHYTGTEHLLLTLASEPEGIELLHSYGIDALIIRRLLEKYFSRR